MRWVQEIHHNFGALEERMDNLEQKIEVLEYKIDAKISQVDVKISKLESTFYKIDGGNRYGIVWQHIELMHYLCTISLAKLFVLLIYGEF